MPSHVADMLQAQCRAVKSDLCRQALSGQRKSASLGVLRRAKDRTAMGATMLFSRRGGTARPNAKGDALAAMQRAIISSGYA